MKKTQTSKKIKVEDMLPEYNFDYRKARSNRFTDKIKKERVIVLDSDISKVFDTSESVNTILRILIKTMPKAVKQKIAGR